MSVDDIYEVYTDGACTNNQASGGQPGGWGVVFLDGRKYSGAHPSTTNNRMELTAVIEALKNTSDGSTVAVYSDSAYIINAFEQNWLVNWLKNGWKTSQGKPVENQDLWKELMVLVANRNVKWNKVKGHSGNKWNDLADKLAVEAIANLKRNFTPDIDIKDNNEIIIRLTKDDYTLLLKRLEALLEEDTSLKSLYQKLSDQYI